MNWCVRLRVGRQNATMRPFGNKTRSASRLSGGKKGFQMSAAAILQQFLDAGPDQARAGYAAVAVTFIDRPTFSSGAFPADPVLVLGCAGGPVWDPSRRIARPAVPRSGRHRPHLQTHQLRRGADRHPLRGRDQRTSYRPEGDNGSPLSQRSRRQDAPRPPRPRSSRKIRRREQLRLRCRARGRAGWSSGHGRAQINASQVGLFRHICAGAAPESQQRALYRPPRLELPSLHQRSRGRKTGFPPQPGIRMDRSRRSGAANYRSGVMGPHQVAAART